MGSAYANRHSRSLRISTGKSALPRRRCQRQVQRKSAVPFLALIPGTVSYLHMHRLVALNGQPGWVASQTPLRVEGLGAGGLTGRGTAMGAAGGRRRREPGRQRRGRRADLTGRVVARRAPCGAGWCAAALREPEPELEAAL
jgi:hypothetical protein